VLLIRATLEMEPTANRHFKLGLAELTQANAGGEYLPRGADIQHRTPIVHGVPGLNFVYLLSGVGTTSSDARTSKRPSSPSGPVFLSFVL